MVEQRITRSWIPAALAAMPALVGTAALAQQRPVPDTYTGVTTNMTPTGVTLKADILEWSDQAARTAVIEALAAENPSEALEELPSVGAVWRSGSAVGHAIKYAHKSTAADGTERVVLVTDKPVGSTSFNKWMVGGEAEDLGYSVIELMPDASGSGTGTMSLAAEVAIDDAADTIRLRAVGGPMLLSDVKLEPKPYWATDEG